MAFKAIWRTHCYNAVNSPKYRPLSSGEKLKRKEEKCRGNKEQVEKRTAIPQKLACHGSRPCMKRIPPSDMRQPQKTGCKLYMYLDVTYTLCRLVFASANGVLSVGKPAQFFTRRNGCRASSQKKTPVNLVSASLRHTLLRRKKWSQDKLTKKTSAKEV